MRLYLRTVFIGLAALALATQAARLAVDLPTAEDDNISAGLAALELRPTAPTLPGTVFAAAPGCAEPVVLTRVRFDGLGRATARALLGRPSSPRFVYLGSVSRHASAAPLIARWAAASVLHVFGLRQGTAPGSLVLVMLPLGCPELSRLDWSRVSPWS